MLSIQSLKCALAIVFFLVATSSAQAESASQAYDPNQNLSIQPVEPDPDGWELVPEVQQDLWLVTQFKCMGNCPARIKGMLKRAMAQPQSFSNPKLRIQYDFIDCRGKMGLWYKRMPVEQALAEANGLVTKTRRLDAKGWGFKSEFANKGYVVCMNPDGSFNKLSTLLDYRKDQMIGFVLNDYLVHYKAVKP